MKETKSFLTSVGHFSCKARYIIADPQRFIKPLSKAVTALLEFMFKKIETYHSKPYYPPRIKSKIVHTFLF